MLTITLKFRGQTFYTIEATSRDLASKQLARWLLSGESLGPGDTIEVTEVP